MTRSSLASLLVFACAGLAQAQGMDYDKLVRAPNRFPLGEGVKVGYAVEQVSKMGEEETRVRTAVVGETEAIWKVETTQGLAPFHKQRGGANLVMGLEVDKETHRVRRAWLGYPKEKPKPIVVLNFAAPQPPKRASAGVEAFALPSGKEIEAERFDTKIQGQLIQSWVGKKGTKLEGVMLKTKGTMGGDAALAADPEDVAHELEDEDEAGKRLTLPAVRVTYTNKSVYVSTRDKVAVALNATLVSIETPGFTRRVVSLRSDAKSALLWN